MRFVGGRPWSSRARWHLAAQKGPEKAELESCATGLANRAGFVRFSHALDAAKVDRKQIAAVRVVEREDLCKIKTNTKRLAVGRVKMQNSYKIAQSRCIHRVALVSAYKA